ncbi:HotDog domain-containing protein, partial [Clohesyomyces aquaticus]
PELLEAFAPLKWAIPLLKSPDWKWRHRSRNTQPGDKADTFCRDTMHSFDGAHEWLEVHKKPASGTSKVKKALLLCRYGIGLAGFPGICHGGAVMTFMDEALGAAMVATETERLGGQWAGLDPGYKGLVDEGRPIEEVLKGYMVTAKLDVKFLRPVLCPGVIGVEVDVLEDDGRKMRFKAVMKNGDGLPLVHADGLYVRIGGAV